MINTKKLIINIREILREKSSLLIIPSKISSLVKCNDFSNIFF